LLGYIFVAINMFGICIVLLLKLSSDLDTRHSSSTHTWNLKQVESYTVGIVSRSIGDKFHYSIECQFLLKIESI